MSDTPMTREPSPHMHDCEHGFDRTLCYCDTPEACLCDTEDDNVEAAPAPTVEPSHLQEAGAASTPMTREQAWDDLLAALKYAWSHGDADHGATLSFLRSEMERLEGERDRLTIAYSGCREALEQHLWLNHGEVLRIPTEVAVNEAEARAEAAEAQLAQAREALERMTHVYCGTNRVSQAVRWARQVLGWDYAKGCAESVEAVAKAHALARLEQGDKG